MQELLAFFDGLTTVQKAIWLFGCLGLAWFLELALPFWKKKPGFREGRHNLVNLVFLLFTFVINSVFGIVTVAVVYPWLESGQFGLLNMVDWPVWLELALALLAFDLIAQYTVHYLLHMIKPLWRFHMIHHSDTFVVATTGTRHHPGDYTMRELFSLLTIVITGAPFAYYMIYRMVTIPFTYLTHANIVVPRWLDKPLSFLFITPNIHKFHHHFKAPWTDSNFGNIFSIWDRMFGTLVYDDPKKIHYGLDVLPAEMDENIGYQLRVPFNREIPDSLTGVEGT